MRTAVAALSMSFHIRQANKFRDQHNPLRGLTMGRAVNFLEEGMRGAYADLQWTFHFIEKRDPTLRGGKRHLLSAVGEMDWDIKTVAEDRLPQGCTKQMAEAQAVTLRTAYDQISNLVEAVEFLGLAEFRGYSHLERILDDNGRLVKLEPVEQWHWCRDGRNGVWTYNRDARSGLVRGDEVDLNRFIIREIDDPIDEIALIAFVRKSLSQKDWDGYVESFGIPSIFAVMPQNVPHGKEEEYQELAEKVISDSRGALPHGADIKTVDAGARGSSPFEQHLKYQNADIVMAITSGALTMLAESGSGTLAGGAHSDTFMRVARSLARRITSCLQAQLDLAILAAAHPGQPPLAYFQILCEEEVDTGEVIKDVGALEQAGFALEAAWVEEKTGYPVTRKLKAPAATELPGALPNKAPATDEDERTATDLDVPFLAAALPLLGNAMRQDFKPLATRLQAILTNADLTEEELRNALTKLREDLPALAAEIGAGEETVSAWQGILGAALANEIATEGDA
jgi:phage gp29-like protein